MSKVKVIHYGLIRNLVDTQEEEVCLSNGATVRELLHLLFARHGDEYRANFSTSERQLQLSTNIQVNGQDINELDGLSTKLENNSRVDIAVFPFPAAGG